MDAHLIRAHLRSLPERDGYELMLGFGRDAESVRTWIPLRLMIGLNPQQIAGRLEMLAGEIRRSSRGGL